jgi:hypothetical protein
METEPGKARRPRGVWGWIAALLLAAGMLIGGAAKVLWTAERIREGEGGVLYRSAWGYTVSAYGLLVWFIAGGLVIALVGFLGWRARREERDFERKYGRRPPSGPGNAR